MARARVPRGFANAAFDDSEDLDEEIPFAVEVEEELPILPTPPTLHPYNGEDLNDEFIDLLYFSTLETDLDRINYILNVMVQFMTRDEVEKDDVRSTALRTEAEMLKDHQNYLGGLAQTNRSLALAKSNVAMAHSYALRSEIDFKTGLYEECIRDVDRAFAHQYPLKWKRSLVLRKRHVEQMRRKPVDPFFLKTPKIRTAERNAKIQCASDRVEIVPHEQWGRQVVATRDLQFGDLIAVEKVFGVANLMTEPGDGIHCNHCMTAQFDLIPCEHCASALFCSEECKQDAYEKYHKYECPIIDSMIVWRNPSVHLGLKMTIMLRDKYMNLDEILAGGQDENAFYRSDDYKVVYNLQVGNIQQFHKKFLLKIAKCAANLYHLVKTHTKLFEDFPEESRELAERNFKIILMKQIEKAMANDVPITEFPAVERKVDLHDFAFGIYPFYNVFNHSCNSNVEAYFHGTTLALRAVLPIKKGEQCTVSYSRIHYRKGKTKTRRDGLKDKYGFMCNCEACRENWHKERNPCNAVGVAIVTGQFNKFHGEILQGSSAGRQNAKDFLVLIKEKIVAIEPTNKIYSFFQFLGRACYKVMGNCRREI